MRSEEVRSSFVEFFADRGHRVSRSSSLVPHGDATLLFTNAGMVPFKNAFLGAEEPAAPRAVSVQKCMRVSGKHNDLENVGPSHRHHTFFEMLGNFSFGDYFKEDAIRFAWELVTEVWGIPGSRLWATVFEEDDEAAELWPRLTGMAPEKVRRCGAVDNFWAMGDTGPCGPCSEIFVDLEPSLPAVSFDEGNQSGRYVEIWNLVFMQFVRNESGELESLPNPSIDTGAGLERVAAVLQQKDSNYASDLFEPLLSAAAALAEFDRGSTQEGEVALRVIGDHLRATTFLLADGVIPSNEGRGYVLRRILRRAVRHGMSLGFAEPFLHRLLPVVREVMGAAYPELEKTERASVVTVETEERKFLETLALGSRQVQEAIGSAREEGLNTLDGESVFRFYDTYGLPLEVIEEIAEEERFGIDRKGFERHLEIQRSRSRAAMGGTQRELGGLAAALGETETPAGTEFIGYSDPELDASKVMALLRTGDDQQPQPVGALSAGEQGVAVLDRTPFYAEAGGQLGDRGRLRWPDGEADVVDTRKKDAGHFHFVEVRRGRLEAGQEIRAVVDPGWRLPTQRNHTATHLLHAALRHVLGEGVRQAGSLVAPDRLRFDFTYGEPLTTGQITRVEELVNRWVLEAEATSITADRDFDEAVAAGAMALFGEKYGERVRTVQVPGLDLVAGDNDG
ncbi:MAG: alanine--tRNA ligase, partial [Acidobacteriota bacterium]|nr:alanine--tRNA ligase [Acidobacteriota bacterium]